MSDTAKRTHIDVANVDVQRLAQRAVRLSTAKRALMARLAMFDKEPIEFTRAGGDNDCQICGLLYYEHPQHPTCPWLNILCDASLVKL